MADGGDIRVLVVAPSALRRAGLEATVRSGTRTRLAGSIASSVALDSQLRELHPDVVVIDVGEESQFPPALADLPPRSRAVIVLIDEPDAGWIGRVLRSGVRAVLPRELTPESLEAAIVAAHLGLAVLDPDMTDFRRLLRSGGEGAESAFEEELTLREQEVLRLLAEGMGNKQIAERLAISDHTVKFHVSSILSKLGATSRTEAVAVAARRGLILL